jgi:hypothetical protein
MGMENARSLKNAIKTFFKDHGREPTMEEFRKMVSGETGKNYEISSVE